MTNDNLKDEFPLHTSRKSAVIVGLITFLLLFGAGGAWVATANIAGAVVTSGSIAIQGRPKTVQHLEGGVVEVINVSDGDIVKGGDVVMKLDSKLLLANLNVYTNRLQEAVATKNRLLAERGEEERVRSSSADLAELGLDVDADVERAQQKLFEARRLTREGQKTQIEEQITQFKNQIVGIKAQRTSLTKQIELLEEQMGGAKGLLAKGYTTESAVRDLKRQRAELDGQLGEIIASEAQVENSINEAEIQILQGKREFMQTVLTELTQTDLEIRDLAQQLQATQTQLERTDIRAPIDGMVHGLSVFTIGGVIGNGAPLMDIVPLHEDLDVEISVEPQFIDELYIGQPAGVRFSAFNQRTTPELTGTIKSVSPTTTTNEEQGVTYYTAKVNVPDEELEKLGDLKLIPGMPVEVFVKTTERTALNYLVKPLLDQVNRAFREE